MAFTYGRDVDDVVLTSQGAPVASTTLNVYASEADARADANKLATVPVVSGRWTYSSDLTVIWVTAPSSGEPWSVYAPGRPGTPGSKGDQGSKGDKGDPGGWVVSTLAGAQDLGPLTTPGLYMQGSTTGTTVALGYPADGFAGLIEVTAAASMYVQKATYFSAASGAAARGEWVRTKFSTGAWSAWRRVGGMSLEGVGSPIGTVDGVVGMTYTDTAFTNGARVWRKTGSGTSAWTCVEGDTGKRTLAVTTGTAAAMNIRRVNSTVELTVVGWQPGSQGTATVATTALPSGFGPSNSSNFIGASDAGDFVVFTVDYDRSKVRARNTGITSPISLRCLWTTVEPWPVTMPGTP